ncbi:hypothetical protein Ddye_024001 [Dipteronia dyeriana]|uniref:Uncharacterized protein n=1 Tax=Dipteronia dyeriana TaxID=168575 RepID=A0AAD9TUL7_9ROSI|nr:hypothetical protein Ddye_024001 [Dipteronia dyeriana]
MISNMRPLICPTEALKRQIEKNKGKKVVTELKVISIGKDKTVDSTEPITLTVDKLRKLPRLEEPSSDSLTVRFPTDISVYYDPGPMLKEVDQLLFLKDETRFTKTGASRVALQSQLFLRNYIKSLSKKVSTLSSSNTKLKKEVYKEMSDLERFAKESSDKLARAKEDNARLRATLLASEKKLSDVDEMLADMLEKLDKAADEAVIQTRGD